MSDKYREALQDIYNSARKPWDGVCRWCGAPPPTDDRDHDVACPAAKAGYVLDLPGYHDIGPIVEFLSRKRK